MTIKEQYWKYSLITIILLMGVVIFQRILPFLGGLLGALTIYILVRRQMIYLTMKRKMKRSIAAFLVTGEAILCFLVPLSVVVWIIVSKVQNINVDPQPYITSIEQLAAAIKTKTGYDVLGADTISYLVSVLPGIGQVIMGGIGSFSINLFVLVFVLFFMLIGGQNMESYISSIVPFSAKNTEEIIHEINMIIRSNAIGIPLLAVIQGSVATIGYLIFGAPSPFILGLLTCFACIIPMVGTALIWVPTAAFMALNGDWFNAIGLLVFGGAIVSQLDNLIRFILQKKIANIHPLITIFGVVIGLRLFGFMGIIFGPVLLSLFCLFIDMFKKEYLDSQK